MCARWRSWLFLCEIIWTDLRRLRQQSQLSPQKTVCPDHPTLPTTVMAAVQNNYKIRESSAVRARCCRSLNVRRPPLPLPCCTLGDRCCCRPPLLPPPPAPLRCRGCCPLPPPPPSSPSPPTSGGSPSSVLMGPSSSRSSFLVNTTTLVLSCLRVDPCVKFGGGLVALRWVGLGFGRMRGTASKRQPIRHKHLKPLVQPR